MSALPTDCGSGSGAALRCGYTDGGARESVLSVDPEGAGRPEIGSIQPRARYL